MKKETMYKLVALILVVNLSLFALQPLTAFAEQKTVGVGTKHEKGPISEELCIPNTAGDLTMEQLESAHLLSDEIPECITREDVHIKGHANRLYEQEPNDNTIVFQNRDGTKTAYFFSTPVKFTDEDGNIKDKQTKLVTAGIPEKYSEKFAYVNKQNDVKIYFPKTITSSQGMMLETDCLNVELSPIDATDEKYVLQSGKKVSTGEYIEAVNAKVINNPFMNDAICGVENERIIAKNANASIVNITDELTNKGKDTVQYLGVFGDETILRYSSTFEGIKEDIVLYKNTGVNNFRFLLKTNGLTLVRGIDKQYYLSDPLTGEHKIAIGELIVYDSNNKIYKDDEGQKYNHYYQVETVKTDEEYILTVVVDEEFLNSSNTTYPVYVDPTMTVMPKGAVEDAAIYSGGKVFSEDDKEVKVGRSSPYGTGRGLYDFPVLNFNTDFILMYGNQISSAKLNLYALPYDNDSSYDASKKLSMYEFRSSWSPNTVKWSNTSPSNFGSYISSANVTYGWTSFDISYVINKFKTDTTYSNEFKGVIIKANSEDVFTWKKFVSSLNTTYSSSLRPYVEITYNDSPVACSQVVSGAAYYLSNYNSEYLDVYNANTTNNTRLLTYAFTGKANQQFKLINVNGGEYEIVPQHTTGKVLSVNSSKQVIIEDDSNLSRQRWYIFHRNGSFHIVNKQYNTGVMAATYDTDYLSINNEYDYCCWSFQKLCGNANYRDVTQHNMFLTENKRFYMCSSCGFIVKSPVSQDQEILSADDYLRMISVQHYYSQCMLLYNQEAYGADYYKLLADNAMIYMDTLRSQTPYKYEYEYCDSQGMYHCPQTNTTLLSCVQISNINALSIGLYNGVYESICSLVIGYYCPEVALLTSVTELVQHEMTGLDFASFVADLYEMSDVSLGLSIASDILTISRSDVAIGDKVVDIRLDGRVSAYYIYSADYKYKKSDLRFF